MDATSRAEAWLYRRLRCHPGLMRLRDQIHPCMAPKGTPLPYAIYMANSTQGDQAFDSSLPEEKTRFTVLIFADGHTEVRGLAKAATEALNDASGWSVGFRALHSVVVERGADRAVQADGGELLPVYGQEITVDVRLHTPRI